MTTQIALQRRREANPLGVGILVTLFSVLASIPLAIRHQSSRLFWMPAAMFFWLYVAFADDIKENEAWKVLAWLGQGAVAGLVAQSNKEKAAEELNT